jgi:hypothetical protein
LAKLPSFIIIKDDAALYNDSGEFYFYVPEKYFDLKIAFYAGEYLNILGILNYSISKDGKKGSLHTFSYPTRFLTKPYIVEKIKDVRLTSSSKKQDYRIFKYKKGDPIIVDIRVPAAIDNVEDFINLFVITGAIPDNIPYNKIQNYFIQNAEYNDFNYKLSLQIIGLVISEICRDPNDKNKSFRLSTEKDMTKYDSIGVRNISKIISAYSAITSDNIDDSIIHATMNDKKIESPLERVLTG